MGLLYNRKQFHRHPIQRLPVAIYRLLDLHSPATGSDNIVVYIYIYIYSYFNVICFFTRNVAKYLIIIYYYYYIIIIIIIIFLIIIIIFFFIIKCINIV